MTIKRERNQRGEGGRLKEELIQAAMRLLDQNPATVLSLRMVAREAGVAAPSIYPHFTDARAMMSEIVRECWTQMGKAMADASDSEPDLSPVAQLQAKMIAFVRYAMDRPSRYQLLFAAQPIEPEESDAMDGYLRPAYRQVIASLKSYAEGSGELPANNLVDSALLILSLTHGRIALAHLAPGREGNQAPNIEQFVCEQIRRIFVGS